ncbi:644_t:CDS:2 [Dentiscutata erythropus]|uniref:644_t:CDS:1 n=1 Tax=Dentiscutata erythropus TaxID=1348616 RepID=A0A9N9D8E8_9GLOM|nr:644_t:CDS:2 [Dentiscutata erythropus]
MILNNIKVLIKGEFIRRLILKMFDIETSYGKEDPRSIDVEKVVYSGGGETLEII